MADLIWRWSQGELMYYTRRFEVAQQAMSNGFSVTVVRSKCRIFKN